jgi:hypothetical protein
MPSKAPYIYKPCNAGIDMFTLQARHMLRRHNAGDRLQLEAHFGLTQSEMVDFLIEALPWSEPGEPLSAFRGFQGTAAARHNAVAAYFNAGCGAVPPSVGADA